MKMITKTFLHAVVSAALVVGCGDDGGGADGGTEADSGSTNDGTSDPGGTTLPVDSSTGETSVGGSTSTDESTGPGEGESTTGPSGPPAPPAIGPQIDRMGRPAISTALVTRFGVSVEAHEAAVDMYNEDDDADTWVATYVPDLHLSLAIYDSLDEQEGNQPLYDDNPDVADCEITPEADCYSTLATVLTNDWLVLNADGSEGAGYLGVETEIIGGEEVNVARGGRLPVDDVIDISYSVLSGTISNGVIVGDTIDAPESALVEDFPYLADPNE